MTPRGGSTRGRPGAISARPSGGGGGAPSGALTWPRSSDPAPGQGLRRPMREAAEQAILRPATPPGLPTPPPRSRRPPSRHPEATGPASRSATLAFHRRAARRPGESRTKADWFPAARAPCSAEFGQYCERRPSGRAYRSTLRLGVAPDSPVFPAGFSGRGRPAQSCRRRSVFAPGSAPAEGRSAAVRPLPPEMCGFAEKPRP